MYNQIKKIPNISPYNIHYGVRDIFCIDTISKNILCIDTCSFNIRWKSHRKDYSFVIINDNLVSNNFTIYNLKGKLIYQKGDINDEWYQLDLVNKKQNIVLYKTVDEEKEQVFYHLFDVKNKKIIYENIKDSFSDYMAKIIVDFNKIVFTNNDFVVLLNINSEIPFLWEKDLKKEYYTPTDEIEIEEVYLYKEDFLIVVAEEGIVKLKLETGELIWKTDDYAVTMEIVDNFGYVCTGLSLYRINLDTGEIYDYNREYARLPDFEYDGKNYWPSGHRVVYHNGLLWYAVYASGDSFIIAINPEDGNYQWIHKVDTYEKIENIQFHQDKMFVSDTGSNLFIYESL